MADRGVVGRFLCPVLKAKKFEAGLWNVWLDSFWW